MNSKKSSIDCKNKLPAIGLLGGTFDPIHLGHTVPVEYVAHVLNLPLVSLLPAHIPPHKHSTTASVEQRLAMVELTCTQHPLFQLDDRELKRTSKSYTVDSIKEIKAQYPNTKIYFFIGTDSLLTLPSWFQIETLLKLCHFVVSLRPGYQLPSLDTEFYNGRLTKDTNDLKQQHSGKILIVDTPQVDISSTQIREKLKQGLDCHHYLTPEVEKYIKQQGLYL